jgi:dienelactone hydrolase
VSAASAYDPFQRGPFPVGVRTFEFEDASRQRSLPVEFWYPATDAFRGRDLDPDRQDHFQAMPMAPEARQAAIRDADPRREPCPLVVFSHGYGGERRQTTHFCTHLASHGYAVVSMDHIGNTTADLFEQAMSAQGGGSMPDPAKTILQFIEDRPADASFVIDRVLAGDGPVDVDADRVGITGHSFGGWTTLATTGRDRRIRAALPLAPAGGASQFPLSPAGGNPLEEKLSLDWDREVPTLYLVAEFDTLLPLEGMRGLIERTPQPRRAVVLLNSDHFHFCDGVEQVHDLFKTLGPMLEGAAGSGGGVDTKAMFEAMKPSGELCPGAHAYTMIQGLGLAHMDAHLRQIPAAAALLSDDLAELLREHGIDAEVIA